MRPDSLVLSIRSNPATISLESSHNIKAVELVDRTFYELRNLLLSRHTEPAFFLPASWPGERCELSNTAFQFRKIPFRKRDETTSFVRESSTPAWVQPRESTFQKDRWGLGGRSRHRALPGVGARGVELNDSFKTAGWRHPKWLTIGRGFRIRFGAGLPSTTSSTPAQLPNVVLYPGMPRGRAGMLPPLVSGGSIEALGSRRRPRKRYSACRSTPILEGHHVGPGDAIDAVSEGRATRY